MSWKKLLESVSESLNEHLRLRNDYLMAENRLLRHQMNGRIQLTDNERQELAELGAKLGKRALQEIATIAKPDTILAWNRKFAGQQATTSQPPKGVGRPRVDHEIEAVVIRMARENRSWGYDRIQGALKNLGYRISDQTVGNILKRHSIAPTPERKKTVTWREFIRFHLDVLLATDFFTSAVWTWLEVVLSCMLLCLHVGRRTIHNVGTTVLHSAWGRLRIVPRSLAWYTSAVRWIRAVTEQEVSRLLQGDDRVRCPDLSVCIIPTSQKHFPQSRGTVVRLPVISHCQTRDGPLRRQQRLGGLLMDANRAAA